MKEKTYPDLESSPDFARLEEEILDYWKQEGVFERSIEERPARNEDGSNNEYVFYDGPPFANGLPHHGHLLTGYVKDLFARYHTMKGKRVERRFGWDCHGLPAEMGAEKELGISGRQEIINFGIDKFNEHCRSSVMQFADQWRYYVNRQGRWVDFDNDYKTMNLPFMESTIWAFSELYKKGLVYEGFKVMPYSWAAETVLSSSEIRLDDATREKEDKAVTVAFKLRDKPEGAPEADNYYICAWTTTPWTLPSNLALAASGELEYGSVVIPAKAGIQGDAHDCYIMAKNALQAYAKDLNALDDDGKLDSRFHGNDIAGENLIGLSYEPLFPYFAGTENAFKILDGSDFIEAGSGTGIVHMAPGFGEDDNRICTENNIPTLVPVNGEGRYTDAIFDLPYLKKSDGDRLETHRCILRAPTEADREHFIALHTNETVMDTMNDGVLSLDEANADFDTNMAHFEKHGHGQWVVEHKDTGAFMGRAGISTYVQSDDVGERPTLRCGLMPEFWHGGYGRELCRASLQWGFEHGGFETISGGAVPHNPRAKVMMQAVGMTHIKDVQFKRMVGPYFEITKDAFNAANPPLSLRGLNVIKETQFTCDAEPYTQAQLEKYGLANLRIINWLKMNGRLVKQEDYKHNYPHCWRTDEPIIYRGVSSWFVDVPKIRDRMVELNQNINWIPDHVKDGRFGKWLENAREWSVSRSRFWGCPVPVWRSDNPDNNELYVFGSVADLNAFFDADVKDLHRPYIDELTKPDPSNPDYTIRRVEEVFDCWFESGSMPYAQVHYPFENENWFDAHFPAQFIVEYEAQTRGWFYNMMVLAVALFDRNPFENCICHGVVLDDSGRKLSKKLQNYMDPKLLFDKFGSDALRWFMMSSSIMRGSELLLDAEGKFIHDAIRLYIKPIWNACHFFTLYANADGVKAELITHSDNVMDRYILAKLRDTAEKTQTALDAYDTPTATQTISQFFEVLNNWYIRRNRARFWGQEKDADKQAAYNTLYTVLHTMCRVSAPLLPMISEAAFLALNNRSPLKGEQASEGAAAASRGGVLPPADSPASNPTPPQGGSESVSVHLARWPDVSAIAEEADLIADMDRVRDACTTLHAIRNTTNIRTRQPLASATLYGPGSNRLAPFAELIADETNVKEVAFSDDLESVANHKLTIHFPVAGKRLGAKMKAVGGAAKSGDWKSEGGVMIVGGEALLEGEYTMQLEAKAADAAQALPSNDALVVLDTTITPQLEAEGTARDLVRMIQQARKDSGLDVSDRIRLHLSADESVQQAAQTFRDYICAQTLCTALAFDAGQGEHSHTDTLNNTQVTLSFSVEKDVAA